MENLKYFGCFLFAFILFSGCIVIDEGGVKPENAEEDNETVVNITEDIPPSLPAEEDAEKDEVVVQPTDDAPPPLPDLESPGIKTEEETENDLPSFPE